MLVDERDDHFCWRLSLSLREICGRRPKDLVGFLEFPVLALQPPELFPLACRQPFALACVPPCLTHPAPKRFCEAANRRRGGVHPAALEDDQGNAAFCQKIEGETGGKIRTKEPAIQMEHLAPASRVVGQRDALGHLTVKRESGDVVLGYNDGRLPGVYSAR